MLLLRHSINRQASDMRRLAGMEDISVNTQDEMQRTPLHYTAWYNKPTGVETLLKQGADFTAQDSEGATPLHYAARYKQRYWAKDASDQGNFNCQVIKLLVDAGADINVGDSYGATPLMYAVLRGNEEAACKLMECEGINIQAADNRSLTALHIAAKYNRVALAQELIKKGANVLAGDDGENTPMHIACMEGNVEIAEMLLTSARTKEGPVINALTAENESPLDFAIENRNYFAVQLCLKYGAKLSKTCRDICNSPLHLAASTGDVDIAKVLIQREPNLVHKRNAECETPIHRAAIYDKPDMAKFLLDKKAELESCDNDNLTPLLMATMHGSEATVRVLMERGANVHALSNKDQTVIHLAANNNRQKTLQTLLDHLGEMDALEVVISADDRMGNSPLHMAAQNGYANVCKLLLSRGADINNKNEDEETALHVAAKCGRTISKSNMPKKSSSIRRESNTNTRPYSHVVRELLSGTDDATIVNDEDEDSNTPLHLAAATGHTRAVQYLIEAGADTEQRNRYLWTPLCCAADGGWPEVARFLLEHEAELTPRDRSKQTALHIAAKKGHAKTIQVLLDYNASILDLDEDGHNPLDVAIHHGFKEAANVIVMSPQWKDALRNRNQTNNNGTGWMTTPLRKLITKMPDVAERVMDQCIRFPTGTKEKDTGLELVFDFEFLDDTYTATHWGEPAEGEGLKAQPKKAFDKDGRLMKGAEAYTNNFTEQEDNHPLAVMVGSKRAQLLYHPLSLALIRHKWRIAQISFFTFLLFYAIFLAMFTIFMTLSKPPYMYNLTALEMQNTSECQRLVGEDAADSRWAISPRVSNILSVFIWLCACIGVIVEVIQTYNGPSKYLFNPTNVLDWFTYITSTIVVAPIQACGVRTDWQWQLGATCLFIAWINLILFLRRLPMVGIYIVMVGEVFVTFIKFFVFCFSLFLIAFGLTFYILLRNQEQFDTPAQALIKIIVMMIGELEYGDTFHGDHSVYFEVLTTILFLVFIAMVTIIIMNLLTGLAVGDVQDIQEQAKLKKLAMQVELALDVEVSLPESLRRKFNCVTPHLKIQPNKYTKNPYKKMTRVLSGPLSAKAIASAVYAEPGEQIELADEDSDSSSDEEEIVSQVAENREHLRVLVDKIDHLEFMMNTLLEETRARAQPTS